MAIPAMQYPFTDRISVYAAEIEHMTRSWLTNDYAFLAPDIRQRYAQTNTGYLTARFFPDASKERLSALARCSLWGLAFDDYYEHATIRTFSVLRKKLGSIIRGECAADQDSNIFYRQMGEIAKAFRQWMPEYWMHRFAHSMEQYIDGMAEEAVYKKGLIFPTPGVYQDIRWKSVDVLQMIDGLEVATECPLPDLVRHHPYMEQVSWLTCRIIAWCNDYFSVEKETGRDVMNFILVLQHAHSFNRMEAVEAVIRLHDEDLRLYQDLTANMPNFGQERQAVSKFIEYNNLMIAGHWRWYITDTHRYTAGGSPSIDASGHAPEL